MGKIKAIFDIKYRKLLKKPFLKGILIEIEIEQLQFLKAQSTFDLQGVCVAVAALMQYFLMSAFCWMLVEGIYLYLFVVKVYNINEKMAVYHACSWGKLFHYCNNY